MLGACGITLMDAGRAGIIAYTMPLWVTLIGTVVLRERLSGRAVAGLGIGLIGMLLLFSVDAVALTGSLPGSLLVLGGELSLGAGTAVIKHARSTVAVTVVVPWPPLLGVLPIAVVVVEWDWRTI